MKLNNRYRRSIKSNLSFYLAASLLTMVALLAFYIFYVAGIGINNYADDFFEKTHLEECSQKDFSGKAGEICIQHH